MATKPETDYIVRTMERSEVDFAIQLAAGEGWNPGVADAACFYQADPEGFLVGILDNRPIGCVSAVSYGNKFGFIGLYIIVPEYRGRGYGLRLWQAGMKRLTGHNIGLDAVIAQEATYTKAGFKRAYRNFRFESRYSEPTPPEYPEISQLRSGSLDQVARYDRQCFPAERPSFLRCWLDQPSGTALGYFEKNLLRGYGVIRRCSQGYKIGPLFADNPDIAERLYLSLAAKTEEGEQVFLDITEANPAALDLVKKYRMREVFATNRMYSQGQPILVLEKVFGVTTFELG
jgi:ribosomal protein S18 acetylase RimI-like enzyme